MTNEEIIKKVEAWQAREDLHPLTCGNNSSHPNLEAVEKGDKVVLLCTECGYVQENIPVTVLGAKFEEEEPEVTFALTDDTTENKPVLVKEILGSGKERGTAPRDMTIKDLIAQKRIEITAASLERHKNDAENRSVLNELLPAKLLTIDPKELGVALWCIFSQNNEVRGPDGKELIEGSWRWWGGYIAQYLNEMYDTRFDYLDFYCANCGPEDVAIEGASYSALVATIFTRMKELGWTFYFTGPKTTLINISGHEPDEETKKLQKSFDKINVEREAMNAANPPLIVQIANQIGVLDLQ